MFIYLCCILVSDPDLGENLLYFGMRVFLVVFKLMYLCCILVAAPGLGINLLYFGMSLIVCCFQVNVFVLYFWYACICVLFSS